jgi:hypothetical protein
MKWLKKYFRSSYNKAEIMEAIEEHKNIITSTNKSLDRLEKLTLDGEEHWLDRIDNIEMECTLDDIKIKRNKDNGSFSATARANCHS